MHSVFLHYAQQVGMDMVILNPAAKEDVTNIPTELRGLLEDAILRGIDTSSLLMNQAERLKSPKEQCVTESVEHALLTPEEHLHNCILNGGNSDWSIYIDELLQTYSPLEIITNHLMKVMEQVGERFGKGEMFLPQVIRAAEAMKLVVEYLNPLMRNNTTQSEQSIAVLATVKGDVHDIGKNICAILLKCNGFKVVDLGVMVDAETILNAAQEHNPAFVGLSGLITPSLSEMKTVVDAFQHAKLKTPILIGGATTSAEHTAKKLAPYYNAPVLWTSDATQLVLLAKKLYAEGENNGGKFSDYVVELMQQQRILTTQENGDKQRLDTLEHSRKSGLKLYPD
jgi:5-methyltetrahydrofolate--homocysteine methyltransferase